MQCPYCRQEMVRGYIQSPRHRIFWTEGKRKFLVVPSGSDVRLSKGLFSVPAVESYCCENCRKIIVDF